MANPHPGKGKPFVKGDPRRAKTGRPKKTASWKAAENELRGAIPRVLMMEKNALAALLRDNPTGAEMVAAKLIHEHVPEAVNRFLGKTTDKISADITVDRGFVTAFISMVGSVMRREIPRYCPSCQADLKNLPERISMKLIEASSNLSDAGPAPVTAGLPPAPIQGAVSRRDGPDEVGPV